MNTNFPQSGFSKFLSSCLVAPFISSLIAVFLFVPSLYAAEKADNLRAVGETRPEVSSGVENIRGAAKVKSVSLEPSYADRTLGKGPSGPAVFADGVDPDAAWARWSLRPARPGYDLLAGFKQITHAPVFAARDLKEFSVEPEDDVVVLDRKMTVLVEDIFRGVRELRQKADVVSAPTVNGMTAAVDRMYGVTDQIYRDIGGMYQEIEGMRAALDNNYLGFEQRGDPSPETTRTFNAASDAMAGRVGTMIKAVEAMSGQAGSGLWDLDGMLTALDHMEKNGLAWVEQAEILRGRADAASRQYKALDLALKEKGELLVSPSDDIPGYFQQQNSYLQSLKTYIQSEETVALPKLREYITGARDYLRKVSADLESTRLNLQKEEGYFRESKVTGAGLRAVEIVPQGEENVCAGAEVKGLNTLKECAKSCRTVCRWKEKVGGNDCYECPSGSPDSCHDVGALPADHPWCAPGGICHADPMMYCVPFGTLSPNNKEKLQCTNCKQRQDMCWQKAGGGMTWTNCKQGCWNGKCVFKGKYQEFEWDGSPEWVHCFECKLPPPPPTCEELGWGYEWKADCEKSCPAPGFCEEITMTPNGPKKGPKAPGPPAGGGPGGNDDGGQPGEGGQQGGSTGSDSGGGGETGPGGGGGKANPPTGGTADQPGGGGAVAGGKEPPSTDGPTGSEGQGEQPKKPDNPGTTAPTQPEKPKTDKPELVDADPPAPPDNQEIRWLRTRVAQTEEKIKDREEIINDPREGDGTKAEAARQLESYRKEEDRLKEQLKAEEEKERERQRKAAQEKADSEAAARERDRTRTRWPDPKVEMRKIRLKELKESIDALKKRAEEIKDALAGRTEHIDRLNREIDLLGREIQHHKDASESGGEDATHARDTIKDLEKELAHKKSLRDELARKLKEAQRQYAAELETLKRNYQRKLYAADENARRQEETKRIDEYFDLYAQLEHTKASRDERNRAFEEKFKDMESQIADAKARGDTTTAEKLEEQLENMKRGKLDWDKQYESQVKNLEAQLYEAGYHRNFDDGVGPTSKEVLGDKLNEYGRIMDNEIAATEKKLNELEQGLGGTRSREQAQQADALKARLDQLRAAREGIAEKQNILKNGYKLPEDIAENIRNSTERYAEGSKNTGADKSFARLFAESLAEEAVHNMNPLVAAKKSVAFGWGVAKGVGTAVKGLAELGAGAVDLTLEVYLTDLGFDIETDALDALNNMISAVGSNANFDGIIKATVAVGGAIDAKLKQLEKSGDIDWATSEFGGEVAGEFVVGDAVIAGAVGKASTLVRGVDEAADAAKVVGKVDEAFDAAKVAGKADDAAGATKVAGQIDEAADTGRTAGKVADDAPVGNAAPKADDIPASKPHETPPARGPPEPKPYNNTKPLPTNDRVPTQLSDDVLEGIEKNQGFKKEHAQRMNEFAQEHDVYLIVRDGNPDSVKFFDDPDLMPKPMSSKAKTAKVGPNQGLVVDPTHPNQAKYWDDAIAEAKKADPAYAKWLEKQRGKALDSWRDYGDYMKDHGYRVNPDSGVIEYVEKLPDGTDKVWKGVHGDYDLHGVYRKGADGAMEHVSFGSGQKFGSNGLDVEGGALRQQLNDKLSAGKKDFIQHGGQDDWVPDPAKVPNKTPDPPVTVFFPDGRPPLRIENPDQMKAFEQMKAFYEGEMGVKWPYPDLK